MSTDAAQSDRHCVEVRTRFGLRSDLAWVHEVATAADADISALGIPLSAAEREEIEARSRRLESALQALHEAALDSAAGVWIDQPAGGILHVLLADPSTSDEHTVRLITAGISAVIDRVAIPGRDLEDLQSRVLAQLRSDADLTAAFISSGVDVRANVVEVLLRDGTAPAVAERLLASTGCRGVEVGYSSMEWYVE